MRVAARFKPATPSARALREKKTMRLFPLPAAWIACFLLTTLAGPARADNPTDPLRLIPAQVDFFAKVEQPRQLVEGVTKLEVFKQFLDLGVVRELYESTNTRRFYQLLAYFEKRLGADRFELLDRLAGGGMALAVKFKLLDEEPLTALLVVQSKDEQLLRRFVQLAREVAEQELARLEKRERLQPASHRGIEGVRLGQEFYAAVVGSALVASNSEKGLHSAIDLHLDGAANRVMRFPQVAEARKLLPPSPAAWLWLNLEQVHKQPVVKGILDQAKDNGTVALFFGGLFNVASRAPFLCAALYQKENAFSATLRFPRGREGMPEAVALHVPENRQASLPLLEPPKTLFSASYFLDLPTLWERRAKLLKPQELKGLDQVDKLSGLFLGGVKLGTLVKQLGPHQRFVVAEQTKSGYTVVPGLRIPAFAVVLEMRDPEFARTAETVLRSAALVSNLQLGNFQFNLKLVEEKHGAHTIVGYRFPEDGKVPFDQQNLRFNFTPCLVKVGNQFLVSSTLELAHDLVDVLEKEAAMTQTASPSTLRVKAYSAGVADGLRSARQQLVTQAIIGQALSADAAREQVRALIALVERIGTLQMQTHYGANEFHVDFRLKLGK
jgi:hypothetical protein